MPAPEIAPTAPMVRRNATLQLNLHPRQASSVNHAGNVSQRRANKFGQSQVPRAGSREPEKRESDLSLSRWLNSCSDVSPASGMSDFIEGRFGVMRSGENREEKGGTDVSMVDRIASLLPSSTEIVCALGLRERLVGVSHECDYPTDVVGLPVLTEPKLDPRGTSGDIDARVQEIVQEGLSVYRLNTDALQTLKPEVIVTQDQCEVCAVSLPDVEDAVQCFLTSDVKVVSLNPEKLSDIWRDIRNVAAATGQQEQAESLIQGLEARLGALTEENAAPAAPARRLPGMARSPDGGRQLDSRTGGPGGRRLRPRRSGRAYAAHYLGHPDRLPAGGDRHHAVRLQESRSRRPTCRC